MNKIVVVGLGYVGLPLALALARSFTVVGLDIDRTRIDELKRGHDRTHEIAPEPLSASSIALTADPGDCAGADVYIVTVPTPIDSENRPDLSIVEAATRTVAKLIERGRPAIVVYESTVYPGVTEDICGPLLEREGGLVRGRDFFLGYSPERINPGDREHTVDKIMKVVAGESPAVLDTLCDLYGAITTGGVFRAASIRAAEAAKVIENAQRDINIAFVNEVAQIFARMDLSVWDVLAAARTKWNFLPFEPGLVGGHCIGVDPFYLSHRAQELGHEPRVILAGRHTNDGMGRWVADAIDGAMDGAAGSVLVLGLTFKENVPDLRNSKVIDVVRGLEAKGHRVTVHDPLADHAEARHEYGVDLAAELPAGPFDALFVAVPHDAYRQLSDDRVRALVKDGGCIADLKGIWRDRPFDGAFRRWGL